MKSKELFKLIVVSILVPLLFFSALEFTQRVRWYFKSGKSPYWLLYGFVKRPKDFGEQIARIAAKSTSGKSSGNNIQEIQIWEKKFPNGISKHNPDLPEYKGIVNSLGFRSYEFTPDKAPGIYRIIATGGSTTAGYESDIDHTYPALLQKKLNADALGARRFEAINAGMGEKELSYINGLLEKELVNYEPDMVSLYMTFNHLHVNRANVNVPKDIYYIMSQIKDWLSMHSLLFLTVREKFNIMFHKEGSCLGDIYVPTNSPKALAKAFLNTPKILDSYRDNLERFAKTCKEHNIRPVFITEACVCKGDTYLLLGKDMDVVYKKMYEIMEDVAIKNGAIFIDAAREMDKIPNKEKLFTDGLHLKPEGNEVLADIIYRSLKEKVKGIQGNA